LVGMENEQLRIDPPIAGKRSLSFREIEKHWSGNAFLLWKDSLQLLVRILPGSEGDHVTKLQGLLSEAGAYNQPLTGIYDRATFSSVRAFQSSKGIKQDGIVGSQTLMFLYHSIDRFTVPKLTAGRK
jgi:peptidoglycan hydrolase-like protein with peptidoglycan-binding domain